MRRAAPHPSTPLPCARPAGVTLVELVVSATLVVGIVGSACLCLISGQRAGDEAERRMGVVQAARVALDRITDDLRLACRLDREYALIGFSREQDGFTTANVDFASHAWRPRHPGEADRCEVSYFVDRDPESGEPTLYRRRDPTPDEEPLAGGYREEIAAGVRVFRLEYYDGVTWHDEWGSATETAEGRTPDSDDVTLETGLPEAVRITLALAPPGATSGGPTLGGVRDAPVATEARFFRTVVRLAFAGRERAREEGEAHIEEEVDGGTVTSTESASTSGEGPR